MLCADFARGYSLFVQLENIHSQLRADLIFPATISETLKSNVPNEAQKQREHPHKALSRLVPSRPLVDP